LGPVIRPIQGGSDNQPLCATAHPGSGASFSGTVSVHSLSVQHDK